MKDITEIQQLENEILNQIKAEAKTQKVDVEKLKQKEIDSETLEKYLEKANENTEKDKKNTIESLFFKGVFSIFHYLHFFYRLFYIAIFLSSFFFMFYRHFCKRQFFL